MIANHLGYCGQTVRAFLARSTDVLNPLYTGPGLDLDHRNRVNDELTRLLAEERTWTSRQLAEALPGCGIAMGARQVRCYLKRSGTRYRRTAQTIKHKREPAKAERAGRVLGHLKAKAAAGEVVLYYLDECGFSPTLPMGYSWSLPRQRKLIR